MAKRAGIAMGGAATLFLSAPAVSHAHGLGERYDLPVPLELYVGGAGAAVLLSFAVIGVFSRGRVGSSYPRYDLLRLPIGRALAHPVLLALVRASSIGLFGLVLVAGLFGTDAIGRNLAPTMIWVVFWIGLAYVSAFVGNVWALVSPWNILFSWAETAYARLRRGASLSRRGRYPAPLGAWPAVVLLVIFAWIEVIYPWSALPFRLAVLVLAYSAVTFAGMFVFGRETWLRNGEIFAIMFGYFAGLSPSEVRDADDGPDVRRARQWNLRPWGAGLADTPTPSGSHAVFIVIMLATVTFDGFRATSLWKRVQFETLEMFTGIEVALDIDTFIIIDTIGLFVLPMLFLAVFTLIAEGMATLGRSDLMTVDLIRRFAVSLVPIALAYHVAHFFLFLAVQGQRMIPLASDPLGVGWDLFGTSGYVVNIAVVNARFVWLLSVAAIVLGHIVAVYTAHAYALRSFPTTRDALRSQYPMLVLMVAYTTASLWIIAQPIVN